MSDLKVPILSIVIGEGGSGGAWLWLWQMRYGCWKMRSTPSCLPKALPPFSIRTAKGPEAAEVSEGNSGRFKAAGAD